LPAVEEFFLHLWDEFDDITGICRHVATALVEEVVAVSAPVIAAASGALLAGAATLLLSQHEFPGIL
jgi:enoyl-CoA hydratase/carnithine racemase